MIVHKILGIFVSITAPSSGAEKFGISGDNRILKLFTI